MASICPPTFPSSRTEPISHTLSVVNSRFISSKPNRRSLHSGISLSRFSDSTLCCRCGGSSAGGGDDSDSGFEDSWRWDFGIQETIRNAIKRFENYLGSFKDASENGSVVTGDEEEDDWDWARWRKHFLEVEEEEQIVSILKSQLANAIEKEDYEDAAKIKVNIAAATTNDTVGKVMSYMKKYVDEESYRDAALLRDYAGAGLVGWWAGISEDHSDPYGRIIHISAEYGRYVARSYSPRQLATASAGAPLFEVYLTNSKHGGFKQQAVYLKRRGAPRDLYVPSVKPSGTSRGLDSHDVRDTKSKLFERNSEDTEDGEDRDDDSSFDTVLRDMIPGVKVKVVKMTAQEKVDMDLISKVIEQIIDEDEEEKDYENTDTEDEAKSENSEEQNDIELDSGNEVAEDSGKSRIAVEVIINDGFIQKMSRGTHVKDLLRVPAKLEKRDRLSFKFTVEEESSDHLPGGQLPQNKRPKLQGQLSMDHVMLDLVKSIGKGKVPMKVLKDVGELINLTLIQDRNRQPLSGSTMFNRIDVSPTLDPLNGDQLYLLI
ncbi:protein EXECUTER 1, chloroplastic isoform X2 [Andrographis paniculata]|uniref:protein EXECUTER 1, chloroplastic isoform X2 n=1 Tax=Andrographis paniculata TaxID=175694 RepID=UPI0021E8AF27|nr:protein EXECUTER 1, chloroplastic isoform X2 [Andrographis paniculata]